jgi:hypothetical protein
MRQLEFREQRTAEINNLTQCVTFHHARVPGRVGVVRYAEKRCFAPDASWPPAFTPKP